MQVKSNIRRLGDQRGRDVTKDPGCATDWENPWTLRAARLRTYVHRKALFEIVRSNCNEIIVS